MKPAVGRVSLFLRLITVAAAATALPRLQSAVYQVGPTRSHTNLQAVVKMLAPGDVVEVDGNATFPGNVTFDNHGSAANPITIRGLRVNGSRPVISGVNGFSGGAAVRFRADHYVFEGFEVTGGGDSRMRRGIYNLGDYVTVRDCVVRDCPGTGISGGALGGSFTLRGVEVHHCGAGTKDHQIYVASDNSRHPGAAFRMEFCFLHDGNGGNNVKSRVGRNEIYFNWIEGARYHELDLIGADPAEQKAGTMELVREDSDVVGNVFYKPAASRGSLARIGTDVTGSSHGRYRFVNNTAVFDAGWSAKSGVFKLQGRCESVEMHNNVFYYGGRPLLIVRKANFPWGRADGITGSCNWIPADSTGIPADWRKTIRGTNPDFNDLRSFDFVPSAGSPLRDAALQPTASPAAFPFVSPLQGLKFMPSPRHQPGCVRERPVQGAPDIGALEHSGGSPPTAK